MQDCGLRGLSGLAIWAIEGKGHLARATRRRMLLVCLLCGACGVLAFHQKGVLLPLDLGLRGLGFTSVLQAKDLSGQAARRSLADCVQVSFHL